MHNQSMSSFVLCLMWFGFCTPRQACSSMVSRQVDPQCIARNAHVCRSPFKKMAEGLQPYSCTDNITLSSPKLDVARTVCGVSQNRNCPVSCNRDIHCVYATIMERTLCVDVHIYLYTHIHIYTYRYLYIYICIDLERDIYIYALSLLP
jgi:hypothetical protein